MSRAIINIDGVLVRETEKAMLIRDMMGTEAWVPKSQVTDNEDGTFGVPQWLVEEKGFSE